MKLIDSVILDCYNHSVWSDLTDLTNCRPETKVKKGTSISILILLNMRRDS